MGKNKLNTKGVIDLTLFAIFVILLVLMFGFATAWTTNILSSNDSVVNYSNITGKKINENFGWVYNFSINHTSGVNNVTEINVTLPEGFLFSLNLYTVLTGSNGSGNTTRGGASEQYALNFTNSSNVLTWTAGNRTSYILPFNQTTNSSFFWFNATAEYPGKYNISVRVRYNWTSVYNETNVTVYINDSVVPAINFTRQTVSFGNYSGNFLINTSAIDHGGVSNLVFRIITNVTGVQYGTNITASNYTTCTDSWNATIDTTGYPEGQYAIYVWANDSNWNINSSTYVYNVTFDNTKPTGTMTCTPDEVQTGTEVTCTCTSTDALSGIDLSTGTNGNTYTSHPSTTSAGTFSQNCSFRDTAGNAGSALDSITVWGTTTSGSSGTSTKTTTTEKPVEKIQSWAEITSSTPAVMTGFASTTGISEITVEVSSTAQNVQITVDKYANKPANVSAAKSDAYSYLHIETKNLAENLKKATIKVQVPKTWVTGKGLATDEVSVFKFDETSKVWNKLSTTFKEEDSTYYYYLAEVTSFSYFVIAPSQSTTISESGEEVTETTEGATKDSTWIWIVVGIVALLILIGGGFALKKKKR